MNQATNQAEKNRIKQTYLDPALQKKKTEKCGRSSAKPEPSCDKSKPERPYTQPQSKAKKRNCEENLRTRRSKRKLEITYKPP